MMGRKILVVLCAVALGASGWRMGGWAGLALVASGLVMWFLLYMNRVMAVLKRTADRPIGYIDSAVMLNAKLKPRVSLLHVLALTRSIGQLQTSKDTQPEVYRWTDPGDSFVTAEFNQGRLVRWQLERPESDSNNDSAQAEAAQMQSSTPTPSSLL
ncbi:glycerate kinase [Ottowia sp.]|uniref:glycerate kinase n=1 Tax=Ottowia sp. TaxID=1898956 RepID=UPI003A8B3F72